MTGAILAGGKSTRFGFDKALIRIGGCTLIERDIEFLNHFFDRVAVVTNDPKKFDFLSGVLVIEDVVHEKGPMGGIYSALKAGGDDQMFFMACDMPCVEGTLIETMIQAAEGFDVVVPRYKDKIEAVFTIYSHNCIEPFKKQLRRGNHKLRSIFPEVKTRYIEISELGLGPEIFFNINSPEDLEKILHPDRSPKIRDCKNISFQKE